MEIFQHHIAGVLGLTEKLHSSTSTPSQHFNSIQRGKRSEFGGRNLEVGGRNSEHSPSLLLPIHSITPLLPHPSIQNDHPHSPDAAIATENYPLPWHAKANFDGRFKNYP